MAFLGLSDLPARTERGDWTEQRVILVNPVRTASRASLASLVKTEDQGQEENQEKEANGVLQALRVLPDRGET